MHDFETVSGSGSRACMNLRKSQALAAGMHEFKKVSGSGSRACLNLSQSQALAAGDEDVSRQRPFLLSFFLAAAAHRFLDKFLVWKINFCTRPMVPLAGC